MTLSVTFCCAPASGCSNSLCIHPGYRAESVLTTRVTTAGQTQKEFFAVISRYDRSKIAQIFWEEFAPDSNAGLKAKTGKAVGNVRTEIITQLKLGVNESSGDVLRAETARPTLWSAQSPLTLAV